MTWDQDVEHAEPFVHTRLDGLEGVVYVSIMVALYDHWADGWLETARSNPQMELQLLQDVLLADQAKGPRFEEWALASLSDR